MFPDQATPGTRTYYSTGGHSSSPQTVFSLPATNVLPSQITLTTAVCAKHRESKQTASQQCFRQAYLCKSIYPKPDEPKEEIVSVPLKRYRPNLAGFSKDMRRWKTEHMIIISHGVVRPAWPEALRPACYYICLNYCVWRMLAQLQCSCSGSPCCCGWSLVSVLWWAVHRGSPHTWQRLGLEWGASREEWPKPLYFKKSVRHY